MHCSEFKRNFDPHRIIVNGQTIIKKSVRSHYPFIERQQVTNTDCDQAENPCEARPIDVVKAREWLRKCDDIHGDHCRGGHGASHAVRPCYLIHVKRMCLVPAQDHPYLALSYVWGKASCISLTSQTLEYLWTEGSLRQEHLPHTINQALRLVALLGQDYLWVDRLCIDQDDGPRKAGQIGIMADIYANSYLTIIAAEGVDASEPLCRRGFIDSSSGEDHNSGVRLGDYESPPSPTSPRSKIMEDLSWSLVTSSEWGTRGWTFQEYYSSRRKLIFHRNTVTWECHCEAWNEMDQNITTRQCLATPKTYITTGLDLSPWPDFHRFARLVCLFNVRYLTYQSDALNAFEGLLSVFGLVFEGGFISGLPQMVFDAALLWQPYFAMERRQPASRSDNLKADMIPPSWSYFGHSGSIHSEDLVTGFNFVVHDDEEMRLPPTQTIPTITWTHSTSRDGPRTRITPSAAECRERYQGKHEDLPHGWNVGINAVKPCNDQVSPTQYFWRDSDPSRQRFWYPIPIRDPASPPTTSHHPRFLHGKTQLVTNLQIVTMCAQFGKDDDSERCADALIRTLGGEWVGYVRLNKSVVDSLSGPADAANTEHNCHLIELSRGSTVYHERLLDRYVEYLYPEMMPAIPRDEVYEFVNVMWVGMVDGGMVERKAVGRVLKSAWSRMSKVEFDATIC